MPGYPSASSPSGRLHRWPAASAPHAPRRALGEGQPARRCAAPPRGGCRGPRPRPRGCPRHRPRGRRRVRRRAQLRCWARARRRPGAAAGTAPRAAAGPARLSVRSRARRSPPGPAGSGPPAPAGRGRRAPEGSPPEPPTCARRVPLAEARTPAGTLAAGWPRAGAVRSEPVAPARGPFGPTRPGWRRRRHPSSAQHDPVPNQGAMRAGHPPRPTRLRCGPSRSRSPAGGERLDRCHRAGQRNRRTRYPDLRNRHPAPRTRRWIHRTHHRGQGPPPPRRPR